MKRIALVLVTGLMALSTADAAGRLDLGSQQRMEAAETNLLIALSSDNEGLRESAAYLLGEIGSTRAVIPLMAILKGDGGEHARIVAALALCRIGDGRGVYAVGQAARFDESATVQQRCAWFLGQYASGGFASAAAPGGAGDVIAVR